MLIRNRIILKISHKTAYTIAGTTFALTLFFPLALTFLEVSHVFAIILLTIGIASVIVGTRLKTVDEPEIAEIPVPDQPEAIPAEIAELENDTGIAENVVQIEEIYELEDAAETTEEVEEIAEEVVQIAIETDLYLLLPEINSKTSEHFYKEEGNKADDVVILEDTEELTLTAEQDNVFAEHVIFSELIIDEICIAEAEVAITTIEDASERIVKEPYNADKPEYYIDLAFEAKFSGDLTEAIKLFLHATEFGLTKDVAQMIILDISSMYKELGRYTEAGNFLNKYLKVHGDNLTFQTRRQIMLDIEQLKDLARKTQLNEKKP
jgi:tetratricopeptide (TPR) repeat protein